MPKRNSSEANLTADAQVASKPKIEDVPQTQIVRMDNGLFFSSDDVDNADRCLSNPKQNPFRVDGRWCTHYSVIPNIIVETAAYRLERASVYVCDINRKMPDTKLRLRLFWKSYDGKTGLHSIVDRNDPKRAAITIALSKEKNDISEVIKVVDLLE